MTFSPWPCSRISQEIEAPLTSGAPRVGVSPPSIKTSDQVSVEPTSPARLSTVRMESLATLYCFPPVRMTAYIVQFLENKRFSGKRLCRRAGEYTEKVRWVKDRGFAPVTHFEIYRPNHAINLRNGW